jgi:uroporphyrinogen-III synthase
MEIKRKRTASAAFICHSCVMPAASRSELGLTFATESPLPVTWIITKSQPHADSVVIQLRRQGLCALAIPCIDHQWRDWPELRRIGAAGAALLFVTSRAAAARIDVPTGIQVAAIAPTTSATLEARGIRVGLAAHGGARELAQAVVDSPTIPASAEVFYPTSDAALRQPEHQAAVAILSQRLRVHVSAVYSTVAPANLAQELAALRTPDAGTPAHPGYCFWSPSAIENFAAARGFELPPGPVVLIGGSTERCWRETAPPPWRHAHRHEAETPLEWSLRFLERGAAAAGS